jgi:hypothetical protein
LSSLNNAIQTMSVIKQIKWNNRKFYKN